MSIESGRYTIIKSDADNLRLTLEKGDNGTFIVSLQPPTKGLGQRWLVGPYTEGNYAIQNVDFIGAHYLAPTEEKEDALVKESQKPYGWRIQRGTGKHLYDIVVPGGPRDGHGELTADHSASGTSTHQVVLRPLIVGDDKETWDFVKEPEH